MSTSTQRRKYSGHAILSKGYRPFFLGAAIWAVLSLLLWVLSLAEMFEIPTAFSPSDWHTHEMIFGYAGAVIAGFLLTAVPNWTGRFPIMGMPLLTLTSLWILGRIAIFFSVFFHPAIVMIIDLSFPLMLIYVIGRELIAGKNWRNLSALSILVILLIANIFFHIDNWVYGSINYPPLLGLGAVIAIIMLIGGRIVPSFTSNWLMRFGMGRMPVSYNRFDQLILIISNIALINMVFLDQALIVASLLFLAAILNIIRLARWAGDRTIKEPMLFVLHVGYSFVPFGFFALAIFTLFPEFMLKASAFHLWTAGAIGMMSMAMMTRVSLGHSGRKIQSDKVITAIYVILFFAIILRFVANYLPFYDFTLYFSATLWMGAYVLFIIRYWRILTT